MLTNYKTLILTLTILATASAGAFAQEAKLLAVLRSNATLQEKSAACRQLAQVATKQSVPTLASLLGDEKLSHMARYALETIPDPSVDDSLRAALGKLPDRLRVGVIGSLGVRRDGKAVEALAGLLDNTDTETVQAAARALGNIGTPHAAKALENALRSASGGNLAAVCEGLLRCAEAMQREGRGAESRSIYYRLRSLAAAAPPVRAAALRGAILAGGKDGVALLTESLRGAD